MALVYSGEGKLSLQEREAPKLQQPRDAIVRVTRSAICTSDLHIKNGAVPRAKQGVVLGHEFVGEIVEAASRDLSTTAKMAAGSWAAASTAARLNMSGFPLPTED